jgi:hypothetical protein
MTNTLPRADIDVDKFDQLIQHQGMRVLWEEAIMCDCVSDTHQPDYNCKICYGSGFIYLPPVQTVVASTSLNGNRNFDTIGMRETGTAYITTLSKDLMGYHDRLTFIDFSSKYSQTIQFKFGKSKPLKRPVKELLMARRKNDIFSVKKDFTIINDGWNLQCSDELLTKYGDDFVITLLFVTAPIYSILDVVHELRATFIKDGYPQPVFRELQKQFMIKREDFIYGKRKDNSQ